MLDTCCCCYVTSVMSDSMWPYRRQPTRLPHPWDSPDKNTGVGCHFLLQCMKVKSEREVAQLCPTLRDPMVCSLPGSSIHRIFQERVLEWGAIAFSDVGYLASVIKGDFCLLQSLPTNSAGRSQSVRKTRNQMTWLKKLRFLMSALAFIVRSFKESLELNRIG